MLLALTSSPSRTEQAPDTVVNGRHWQVNSVCTEALLQLPARGFLLDSPFGLKVFLSETPPPSPSPGGLSTCPQPSSPLLIALSPCPWSRSLDQPSSFPTDGRMVTFPGLVAPGVLLLNARVVKSSFVCVMLQCLLECPGLDSSPGFTSFARSFSV